MNKFHKVSLQQFQVAMEETTGLTGEDVEAGYDDLKLPCRATRWSAGYDFFSPFNFSLAPGTSIKIPTGISVELDPDKVLMCLPRSGLGFKYKTRLANTCGVVDADYKFADNEGHIFLKLCNEGDRILSVNQGEAIAQGIIMPYFVTDDDCAGGTRVGGMGSTDSRN